MSDPIDLDHWKDRLARAGVLHDPAGTSNFLIPRVSPERRKAIMAELHPQIGVSARPR